MHWRPFHHSDLSFCLELQPACLGDQLIGRAAALKLWTSLIQQDAFLATVIEADRSIAGSKGAGSRIVGCGMGLFVRTEFADAEIATPRPGLNARILANYAEAGTGSPPSSPPSVVLNRDEIARGNSGDGLDFVNLYGTWRDGVLTPEEITEAQVLLGTGFAEQFAGYRFRRVLKEAVGAERIALARATGTYRIVAEYPERHSALAVVTRESALAAPYSVGASIYRYQPPLLRLRPAEQQLLAAALSGKTDPELSTQLGLSLEATKKRWLSIFDRVSLYKPAILGHPGEETEGRGPQKRHRIVAYIRSHPEELRPYAWRDR